MLWSAFGFLLLWAVLTLDGRLRRFVFIRLCCAVRLYGFSRDSVSLRLQPARVYGHLGLGVGFVFGFQLCRFHANLAASTFVLWYVSRWFSVGAERTDSVSCCSVVSGALGTCFGSVILSWHLGFLVLGCLGRGRAWGPVGGIAGDRSESVGLSRRFWNFEPGVGVGVGTRPRLF